MANCRDWLFTSFELDDTLTKLEEMYRNQITNYLIFQYEICPKTQKEHMQGFFQLKDKKRIKPLKKLIGDKVHLESRKGSVDDCINYCSKVESKSHGPYLYGKPSKQGTRNDISKYYEDIKTLRPIEVLEQNPVCFIKYPKAIKAVKEVLNKERSKGFRQLYVEIITGKCGTGKTRSVYDRHGYDEIYKLDNANNLWWDGYEGEPVLLIDDFYGQYIKYGHLLNILDGYPLRLEIKGGFTYANFTTVYITSNKDIDEWYPNVENTDALKRRISKIVPM